MKVEVHPEASNELIFAKKWYEEKSEGLGNLFYNEINNAVETIIKAPYTWPSYIDGTHRFVLRRFPFALIFFINNDLIQIIAFMHFKRKPNYWKKRQF